MTHNDPDALIQSIIDGALPLEAIHSNGVQELLLKVSVVYGYDPRTARLALFYGKEMLEDIARGRESEFGPQMILCFIIDVAQGEDQQLHDEIKRWKGSCCYRGGDGLPG